MLTHNLFQKQLDKTEELRRTAGPQTEFGQRMVELSRAYCHELFTDDLIAAYLDELVAACDQQAHSYEIAGNTHTPTYRFLVGMLELSDIFENLDCYEMEDWVRRLESELSFNRQVLVEVAA